MSFWNNAGEPLRQYRWYVTFGGTENMDTHRYALKKVDKPKAKVNEITHKYLNHFYYYPGRLEWEAINMTFAAVTVTSIDQTLVKLLEAAGYVYPLTDGKANIRDTKTISKSNFGIALGDISIIQIDSNGNEIEQWELQNPFFTSVQFGSLDYSSEEIVEITTTVRYDSAKFIPKLDSEA